MWNRWPVGLLYDAGNPKASALLDSPSGGRRGWGGVQEEEICIPVWPIHVHIWQNHHNIVVTFWLQNKQTNKQTMDDLPILLRPQLLHWESFPYPESQVPAGHVATATISPAHCYKIAWELGPKRTKERKQASKNWRIFSILWKKH